MSDYFCKYLHLRKGLPFDWRMKRVFAVGQHLAAMDKKTCNPKRGAGDYLCKIAS